MSDQLEKTTDAQLIEWIDAACRGEIGDDALLRLTAVLADDAHARQLYVDYCELHTELYWSLGRLQQAEASPVLDLELPTIMPVGLTPEKPIANGIGGKMGLWWRDSLVAWHRASDYFDDHPMALAYLITTTLFFVAAPILWHWKVSISCPSVTAVADSKASPSAGSEESPGKDITPRAVGRITRDANCRWTCKTRKQEEAETRRHANSTVSPSLSFSQSPSLVCLGDRLTVTSGSLEITYETGAKVVLDGPCSFNVETNGGFLAVGRLTGVMEKKVSCGQKTVGCAKPQAVSNRHPSPSSLASRPSFIVATPTALITDLGTEFGVDVDRDKATTIHVIRGMVEASRSAATGGRPICERLTAGQAVYIASLNDLPVRLDLLQRPLQRRTNQAVATGSRLVLSSDVKEALRKIGDARRSQIVVKPIGLVASAYCHVWDKNGKPAAENNRQFAFRVATDGIFGRGVGGEDPRSSFDTALVGSGRWAVGSKSDAGRGARGEGTTSRLAPASTPGDKVGAKPQTASSTKPQAATSKSLNPQISKSPLSTSHSPLSTKLTTDHCPPTTAFVGLRYDHPVRFDRIKVFLAKQEKTGGSWATTPRVFILKHPVDTDTTPPENDKGNWREITNPSLYGGFSPNASPGPGAVIELMFTAIPPEKRTGYGWAIGGVAGNGSQHYISVTELRAYTSAAAEEDENEE